MHHLTTVSETIRKLLIAKKPKLHQENKLLDQENKKYGEERFSIWRMKFIHLAMWHVALG